MTVYCFSFGGGRGLNIKLLTLCQGLLEIPQNSQRYIYYNDDLLFPWIFRVNVNERQHELHMTRGDLKLRQQNPTSENNVLGAFCPLWLLTHFFSEQWHLVRMTSDVINYGLLSKAVSAAALVEGWVAWCSRWKNVSLGPWSWLGMPKECLWFVVCLFKVTSLWIQAYEKRSQRLSRGI